MSTIFLTGGSGFLGQHLIRQLRAAGHAVRALARSPASRALIERGKLPGAPPGAGSLADVREVARAHLAAYERDRRGESYLLGGEHARMLDLVQRIVRRLGRPTPTRAMPAWLLTPYAALAAAWAGLTGTPPEITPEAAALTCMDLEVDSTKAMRELDYRQTPLDPLLDDTIAWMREQGALA